MDYLANTPFVRMPKPSNERSRDVVPSVDELRKIYKTACNLDDIHAGFVRLLILTGQWRGEIANLKWQEIFAGHFQLKAVRSKSNQKTITPLKQVTSELLAEMPRNEGDFVFSTTGGYRRIGGFSKLKLRLDELVEFEDWRFHDFRRSLATALEEQELDRFTIQCVLNHTDNSKTAVYDCSSNVNRKRRALEQWKQLLFETTNVIRVVSG